MSMLDFTFLTIEQLLGENKLKIFNKIGYSAHITDFAILLGGYVEASSDSGLFNGYYWTKDNTITRKGVYTVACDGECRFETARDDSVGVRPIFDYSKIVNYVMSNRYPKDGINLVEYGEYPQKVAPFNLQEELELKLKYEDKSLKLTGKTYTIKSGRLTETSPLILEEYIYKNGKKYVRVKAKTCFYDDNELLEKFILSDGNEYKNGEYVWVEVDSIKWIVDMKNGLTISKDILLAGIIFNINDYDGNFDNTIIKKYLDTHFSKDIIPSNIKYETNDTKKINPYNFDYESVSEEDIIRGMVESNIAVFLHGKSSDGKSARVKELDPDCEIIYLVNATPDSLNGKTVFNSNTNEMIDIPPTWFIKLK